jgi:hypothetical protein
MITLSELHFKLKLADNLKSSRDPCQARARVPGHRASASPVSVDAHRTMTMMGL